MIFIDCTIMIKDQKDMNQLGNKAKLSKMVQTEFLCIKMLISSTKTELHKSLPFQDVHAIFAVPN